MNTLTENERNSLDDIFLSIHVKQKKYSISKYLSLYSFLKKSIAKTKKHAKRIKKV